MAIGRKAASALLGLAVAFVTSTAASAKAFGGDAFLSAVESGAVWCVGYRPSDESCTFILYTPAVQLSADGPITAAVGYALIDIEAGAAPAKLEQYFRYYVDDQKVCLRGGDVALGDIRLYRPATDYGYVASGDRPIAPAEERTLQEWILAIWAEYETTCWSYALEEIEPELRGPEIAMQRYDGALPPIDALFGAFFETDALDRLRLRR